MIEYHCGGNRGDNVSTNRATTTVKAARTLFVDDGDIRAMSGLERVIHPAEKYDGNPVLSADEAWEGERVLLGGTVLKEGDRFRMWYQSGAGPGLKGFQNLYAESQDGIHWTRHVLRQFKDFRGSLENNIYPSRHALRSGYTGPANMKLDHNQSVLHTPHMGEGRRYTMLSYGGGFGVIPYNGYGLAFSEDGIRWSDGPDEPVIPGFGDVGWFMYDEQDSKFRGVVKTYLSIRGHSRRSVMYTESDDALNWTLPRPAVLPDLKDDEWAQGHEDYYTQFYGMPLVRYESVILGLLEVFRCIDGAKSRDGYIDVRLVSSRDGRDWQRVGDRSPIVERGAPGEWDWGIVQTGNSLVVDDDMVRVYFTGSRRRHGRKGKIGPQTWQAIGMGSWPRDRIVGLRGGPAGGELLVNQDGAGGELHVNANAEGGSLVAEIADEYGRPVQGFEAANCLVLSEDALDHTVRWRGAPSYEPIEGRACQVRIKLANAELFSLWWKPAPNT